MPKKRDLNEPLRRDNKGRIKENKYTFVLYPDSTSYDYNKVLDFIRSDSLKYVFAPHWSDVDKNGVFLKKPHTHIFVQLQNPRVLENYAQSLGLHKEDIDVVRNEFSIIKYFNHKTKEAIEANKVPYDWHDFESNFELSDYYVGKGSKQAFRFADLLSYIESVDGFISYSSFAHWAVEHDCISEYIRAYSSLKDIIKEHNDNYRKDIQNSSEWQAFETWQGLRREVVGGIPFGFYSADKCEF